MNLTFRNLVWKNEFPPPSADVLSVAILRVHLQLMMTRIPMRLLFAFSVCATTALGFTTLSLCGSHHYCLRLESVAGSVDWESIFPNADILTITLQQHRPLGCTVEESLAKSDLKPVFISKVRFFVLMPFHSMLMLTPSFLGQNL